MAMNPRLLVPRATFDPDAAAYLRAVEAADGQALETPVKRAVDDFFRGTKADGTFSALKTACLLCGARTLSGALVPLVGAAPTNENFVSGDYNRETGLLGNGTTKSINSNRNADADPQNSFHMGVYATTYPSSGTYIIGDKFTSSTGWNAIYRGATAGNTSFANRRSNTNNIASQATGFIGSSRSESASYVARINGSSSTFAQVSLAPQAVPIRVFSGSSGVGDSANEWSDPRLAFYSIGESLDLALLDAHVSALITAIGNAI